MGDDLETIAGTAARVLRHREEIVSRIRGAENPYGDGRAGERIAEVLKRIVEDEKEYRRYAWEEPDYRFTGHPTHVLLREHGFAGWRVEEVEREHKGLYITLIYDENGRPITPYPERRIKNGWSLRIWGPEKLLEKIT